MFLLKNLRLGIFLTIAIGLLGPIDRILINHQSSWSYFTWGLGLGLCIPTILLAWALGVNLISGRFLKPSLGAVDNGAACAILLALADELASKTLITKETKVTIALFSGEEVNMQGSRAYVNQREWNYPTVAINLEVMAQNGEYVYWEQDGNSLGLMATSEEANQLIKSSVNAVTGHPPEPAGPINSDGFSFLSQGIPTGILGTYDMDWKDTGFHRPSDNLQRVVMERLPQGVDILKILITKYDQEATCHGS
jgi:Zn-dependent M28 family amino/carboxypeptidase